jgi:hypothetical protein
VKFAAHRLGYAPGHYVGFSSTLLQFHAWTGAYARLTVAWRVGHPWRRRLQWTGTINVGSPR